MLELLLEKLNINATEYSITHTKKEFDSYSENGKLELLMNGCATVKWSNISPYLVVSKKEIAKAERVKREKLTRAYKNILLDYTDDLRVAKFNSYELANLETFFGKGGKEAIVLIFKNVVKTKKANREDYLNDI